MVSRFVFVLACLLLFVTGCGDSHNDYVATAGQSVSGPTTNVRLQSVLAQSAVPSRVVAFRATGFDREQTLLFGPVTHDKAAVVEWSNVPVGVVDFVIEYLDANGQVIALSQSAVELVAGETVVIENPTLLMVSSALERVTLDPTSVTVAKGTSASLELTGHFSDGSTLNLTSAAGWTSSAPAVAVDAGTVRGAEPGTATVTASFGGKSAQAQVTVTDATLVSLRLSPNSPAIAVDTEQDFTVEGFFSDGSFDDVTDKVEWDSGLKNVATIANGTAQGLIPGQTTITASLDGKSTSTVLTVTSATLTSLEIDTTDGLLSIAKGTSTTFRAVGHFSNGSEQDLTSAAVWESDSASASVVKGLVRGEITGSGIEISASFGGKSDTVIIDVTAAEVVSLRVETVADDGPTLVNVGDTIAFKAIATFSDGNEGEVTNDASWVSHNGNVASVANGNPSGGTVTGVAAGQADIKATFGGKTAELRVTVQVAPLPDLALPSGIYTFNTDTGVLSPRIGNSATAPGWNNSEKRLVLNSFTVASGATLNLKSDETSPTPFKVKAQSGITVTGDIHFDGANGIDGTDGADSTPASDGAPGTAGGDVNLFCLGDITVTGTISANGGHGGAGGSYIVSRNRGTVSGGNGGRGGDSGQIQLHAGDSLDTTSATLSMNGGNGGTGGDVTVNNFNLGTATGGAGGVGGDGGTDGGNGGAGGNVTIDGTNDNYATGGAGGAGGAGGTRGGNGGAGGNFSTSSYSNVDYGKNYGTATGGAGGVGGDGGTQGGNAGAGGKVTIEGDNENYNSNATAIGGAGGVGGDGGSQGGNGGAGGNVAIYGTNHNYATGGAGGDGGTPGGNGGSGGNVTIYISNQGTATGGAGGAGGEPGGTDGSSGSAP